MFRKDSDPSRIKWPPGSGSVSVIQDYEFTDPDLEEILTDPLHWNKLNKILALSIFYA
jgi:hypothetical protein